MIHFLFVSKVQYEVHGLLSPMRDQHLDGVFARISDISPQFCSMEDVISLEYHHLAETNHTNDFLWLQ